LNDLWRVDLTQIGLNTQDSVGNMVYKFNAIRLEKCEIANVKQAVAAPIIFIWAL